MRPAIAAVSVSPTFFKHTTIGAICDQFGGSVQTGPFGSQLHASDYTVEGTPVVMPQDMADGRILSDAIARVGEGHVTRLAQHQLETGDIVFSRRGDVSRFAVVGAIEEGWLCGTGSIRIRLNCPDIDTGYLRRFLQQDSVGAWLLHNAKGVTMPNLNTGVIRAIPFAYPPLHEQRRTAAILDQADDLRRKRQEAVDRLNALSRSIFLDSFGDPAINRKAWPTKTLGLLSLRFSDGPFGSNLKSEHYVEKGVRVIRLQNIGVGEFVDDDKAYISESHFEKLKKHICLPGDVLIGTLGDPNLRAVIQPNYIPLALNKADCVQMRVDTALCVAEYICELLNNPSVEAMAQNKVMGQTRLRISMGRLRELSVPVPPLNLQRAFAARVAAIDKLKAEHRAHLAKLDALFASLQHRAFRGEL